MSNFKRLIVFAAVFIGLAATDYNGYRKQLFNIIFYNLFIDFILNYFDFFQRVSNHLNDYRNAPQMKRSQRATRSVWKLIPEVCLH